jgi:hypothetical protein
MKYYRAITLFLCLVWREWENKSCSIPDPFRANERISWALAWDIASSIHLKKEATNDKDS